MKTFPLVLLCLFMLLLPAGHATGQGKPPAKKEAAPKVVDPKQVAEDKRFEGTDERSREALLELDKLNRNLVDTWVQMRDAQASGGTLDLVWGTRARRDAEKQKASLGKLLPRLRADFDRQYERQRKRFDRELERKNKEIEKLAARPSSSNERLKTIQAEELAAAREDATRYEAMLSAMEAMEASLSGYRSGGQVDRLSQIGINRHASDNIRKAIDSYSPIIEAAFDIKDLEADIAVLETRKAEGKGWQSSDEVPLMTFKSNLERAGQKIEKLVERGRNGLKREIDKMKADIERLESRIKDLPEKSNATDRLSNEKWDLEAELFRREDVDALLARLAVWKDPEQKAPAAKEAEKKP